MSALDHWHRGLKIALYPNDLILREHITEQFRGKGLAQEANSGSLMMLGFDDIRN